MLRGWRIWLLWVGLQTSRTVGPHSSGTGRAGAGLFGWSSQQRDGRAGAGLTASYVGSDETEVVTSGLAVLLANITGGLPGSDADGSVAYKARAAAPSTALPAQRRELPCVCTLGSSRPARSAGTTCTN